VHEKLAEMLFFLSVLRLKLYRFCYESPSYVFMVSLNTSIKCADGIGKCDVKITYELTSFLSENRLRRTV
jgi:hypothetical protein